MDDQRLLLQVIFKGNQKRDDWGVLGWEKRNKWESDRVRNEGWMGECQAEKRGKNGRLLGWEKRDEWESAKLRKKW